MSEKTPDFDDLKRRVFKFMYNQLPGQPKGVHMGTSYLVSDLWAAVRSLQNELEAERQKTRDARVEREER